MTFHYVHRKCSLNREICFFWKTNQPSMVEIGVGLSIEFDGNDRKINRSKDGLIHQMVIWKLFDSIRTKNMSGKDGKFDVNQWTPFLKGSKAKEDQKIGRKKNLMIWGKHATVGDIMFLLLMTHTPCQLD